MQGFGGAPVQQFGAGYGSHVNRGWGWGGGWSSFFWVRLVIIGIAISLSVIGACVRAIAE